MLTCLPLVAGNKAVLVTVAFVGYRARPQATAPPTRTTPASVFRRAGRTTRRKLDPFGRVVEATDPDGVAPAMSVTTMATPKVEWLKTKKEGAHVTVIAHSWVRGRRPAWLPRATRSTSWSPWTP